MDVRVDIDTSGFARLAGEVLRQLPYATNSAITRTAKDAALAAQKEAREHLEIRKTFLIRRIRVLQYSRVQNLEAVIGVDTNVQGSPLIVGMLEEGQSGEKTGSTGGGVAVPLTGSPARPSFPKKVTPRLLYKRLDIQKHVTASGAIQWKGKQRTFAIPGVGIFQRQGRAPKSSRRGRAFISAAGAALTESTRTVMIYSYKNAVKLGPHVRLRAAMLAAIRERFATNFNEEFAKELRSRAVHLASK